MRNKSTIVTLVLLLLIGIWVADFLDAAGVFTEPEPRMPGTCTRVSGPIGVEDITIDQQTGIAYFSATDRRALARGEAATGKIYAYDLEADEPQPVDLTPRDGAPGCSLTGSASTVRRTGPACSSWSTTPKADTRSRYSICARADSSIAGACAAARSSRRMTWWAWTRTVST